MLSQSAAHAQNDLWTKAEKVKRVTSKCHSKRAPSWSRGNFHLFSKGLFLFPKLHSNDSVDERTDTWSSRRSDQYPPGFGNTRGQDVEQLIGRKPKITCSLSRHLWPHHWHSTWLDWSNINRYRCRNGAILDFQLLCLLSFIHFTF